MKNLLGIDLLSNHDMKFVVENRAVTRILKHNPEGIVAIELVQVVSVVPTFNVVHTNTNGGGYGRGSNSRGLSRLYIVPADTLNIESQNN